jgi:hypothetical protein
MPLTLRHTGQKTQIEDKSTEANPMEATRSVLVVRTAVCYDQYHGIGVGLVQRIACAKTGKTKSDVLATQKQGLKIGPMGFAASKKNPHRRADMLALLQALHLANATVKTHWRETAAIAPSTVVILLGRPCKEVMDIITHHIEYGPESYKLLQAPHRATVKRIIK